ncbi:MAG: hypothetical protein K2V38_24625 [Gemmataceae bacterium]|nr:hypothetical protein [Gemmataceae bacterium]
MRSLVNLKLWLAATATLVTPFWSAPARAGFILTREAPGVQTSQVGGVVTETFDSIATGPYQTLNTAVGTITSPTALSIFSADRFGGAGGTGRYFAVGFQGAPTPQASLALALGVPQSYFGFWWSAADPQNLIEFYSGGSLVAFFNPTTALGDLTAPAYFGNPNAPFLGQNPTERYAYMNFIGTNGSTFDRVVFRNSTQSGFEADNFSIRAAPVGTLPGTIITGGVTVVSPVPAPPAALLLASGCTCVGLARLRRVFSRA